MAKDDQTDGLTRAFLISGLLAFATVLMVHGASVFVPLAIAMLIWFLINAIAGGIQQVSLGALKLPRSLALALSMTGIAIAGFFMVNLVVTNISEMSGRSIDFEAALNPLIDRIADFAGVTNKAILNQIFDKMGIEQLFGRIVSTMTGFASQLGIIMIYVLFLLVEQQFFDAKLTALLKNKEKREWVRNLLDRISRDIQNYVQIMTFVSILTAALSYLAMVWVGLEQAAFWAFLIFILNFIPTIGSVLGSVLPSIYALLQFQSMSEPVTLLAIMGIIQFATGNVLQPRLAGRTLNMSQFVVILSLFVWGAIWGVTGMFLAVPLTAIIMLVCSNFETTRPLAILMSQEGRIETAGSPE